MRILSGIALAATLWLLVGLGAGLARLGAGRFRYGRVMPEPENWPWPGLPAATVAAAVALFVAAGLLFGAALLGPFAVPRLVAGGILVTTALWSTVDIASFDAVGPASLWGVAGAVHAPGSGYALLMGTALSATWLRSDSGVTSGSQAAVGWGATAPGVVRILGLVAALGVGVWWLGEAVGMIVTGDGLILRAEVAKPPTSVEMHVVQVVMCAVLFAIAGLLMVQVLDDRRLRWPRAVVAVAFLVATMVALVDARLVLPERSSGELAELVIVGLLPLLYGLLVLVAVPWLLATGYRPSAELPVDRLPAPAEPRRPSN